MLRRQRLLSRLLDACEHHVCSSAAASAKAGEATITGNQTLHLHQRWQQGRAVQSSAGGEDVSKMFPKRRLPPSPAIESPSAAANEPAGARLVDHSASVSATAAASQGGGGLSAEEMQAAAKAASRWMFPWEKRHMEGGAGPLRWWEKAYWIAFVGGLAVLLASRLARSKEPEETEEEAAAREAAKAERARLVLAGNTFIAADDDVFEGMTPQEIQAYIEKVTGGATKDDPFEGMSPEEINEYLERHTTK